MVSAEAQAGQELYCPSQTPVLAYLDETMLCVLQNGQTKKSAYILVKFTLPCPWPKTIRKT